MLIFLASLSPSFHYLVNRSSSVLQDRSHFFPFSAMLSSFHESNASHVGDGIIYLESYFGDNQNGC